MCSPRPVLHIPRGSVSIFSHNSSNSLRIISLARLRYLTSVESYPCMKTPGVAPPLHADSTSRPESWSPLPFGDSALANLCARRILRSKIPTLSGLCRGVSALSFPFSSRDHGSRITVHAAATLLESTLVRRLASVHSTGLTVTLTSLESTLTKNPGEGGARSRLPRRRGPRATIPLAYSPRRRA
jgi:hypothetical protein